MPTSAAGRRWWDWRPRIRRPRLWLIPLGLLILNVVLAPILAPGPPPPTTIPYSTFKEQVQAGNVAEITTRGEAIQGIFRSPMGWPDAPGARVVEFETRAPTFPDISLLPLLESKGVVVNARPLDVGRAWWVGLLVSIAPALLISALLIWMIRRIAPGRGGAFGMGRSPAKRYVDQTSPVTFADVAGIDEARQELVEIVDFLKNPERYRRLGGTIPKGVLLVGPPGTGKTLLARAVAGEAGVPFFSQSASEFVEMVVGVGASRVRDLFAQAKKEAPAIVFVDELDAVGRARGAADGAGPGEREQTLNQILVEMDGFDARQPIIVLAATNRPDVLDAALLRPGRFDRRVTVPRPDRVGREKILAVHTRDVPLAPDVRLADLAAATPGLAGADLRNLVNEAALLAARNGKSAVERDDFSEAMEKIMLGATRSIVLSDADRRRVAYHEAGHALLAVLLPEADPVHKVTILPRGPALGVTYQVPVDDRHNLSREYLDARIVVLLGGRAAEDLVFGNATTGAENDLKVGTGLARRMVTSWGMSDDLGLMSLDAEGPRWYSEETARTADREVRRMLERCHAEAVDILTRERARLDALAEALLRHETLNEDEVRSAIVGMVSNGATAHSLAEKAPS